MKPFLSIALLTIATTLALLPVVGRSDENSVPPNILLMMADDMGMGDTSAYRRVTGNTRKQQLATPQIERLARMGVLFTDAHTSSTRCTGTRYGLLTGRYPWRSRLKHWVLFGSQGDPLIEAGRPTIATMLRGQGYQTGMVGKWHLGLRYRKSDGTLAAGWDDADLTKPLADSPLDHGFDFCRFTSRSHGTSGPDESRGRTKKKNRNLPDQNVGPGHIDGRTVTGATRNGKQLVADGANAYRLSTLGSRHATNAKSFIQQHISQPETRSQPFFLYYACNSNHSPYTPVEAIDGKAVAGAAKTMAGEKAGRRGDFIYETDVALGYMLDYLNKTADPRRPGKMLLENTIVIFTSDNGAEVDVTSATGPFRSNKGSVYEGGHRVPFVVAWKHGGVGDGDAATVGGASRQLIALHDLFATFAEIAGAKLPDLRKGETGAEDSRSVLAAWRGKKLPSQPLFMNDHKQTEADPAVAAIRVDNPQVGETTIRGQWKLLLTADLLRKGTATLLELFELSSDPQENVNRLTRDKQTELVTHLKNLAMKHRNAGGHRNAALPIASRVFFDWRPAPSTAKTAEAGETRLYVAPHFQKPAGDHVSIDYAAANQPGIKMKVTALRNGKPLPAVFNTNEQGLGIVREDGSNVAAGDAIQISFSDDVLIESAAIIAGDGACGGSAKMGQRAPVAIYCIDADNDAQNQTGVLSDLGVLPAGQKLTLSSAGHLEAEQAGAWRLAALNISILKQPAKSGE